MSPMFHTASTVCRPGNALRSTLCVTTASGCALPPSTVATFLPSTKYSQLLVRCRAVITQVKVDRGADRLGRPVAALVGQHRELRDAAVARPQALGALDALRLELDLAAVRDRARGAQRLPARRRGDVAVGQGRRRDRQRRPDRSRGPPADRRWTCACRSPTCRPVITARTVTASFHNGALKGPERIMKRGPASRAGLGAAVRRAALRYGSSIRSAPRPAGRLDHQPPPAASATRRTMSRPSPVEPAPLTPRCTAVAGSAMPGPGVVDEQPGRRDA